MEVWRRGETSRYIGQSHVNVTLSADGAHRTDCRRGVRFDFTIRVPGGRTRVHLWASPADFKAIANVMMSAEPEAAQRAFLKAMLKQAVRKKKKS